MARILLADDAADIRLLVRVLLSGDSRLEIAGEATTPEETLSLTAALAPDVIVLDQGFRGEITGMQIAPELKRLAPNTRIILFTAYDDISHAAHHAPEIDAFVVKTDSDKLLSVITSLLGDPAT